MEPADGISAANWPAQATETSIRPVFMGSSFMGSSRAGLYRLPEVESIAVEKRATNEVMKLGVIASGP
jgi:hypothetical protein